MRASSSSVTFGLMLRDSAWSEKRTMDRSLRGSSFYRVGGRRVRKVTEELPERWEEKGVPL